MDTTEQLQLDTSADPNRGLPQLSHSRSRLSSEFSEEGDTSSSRRGSTPDLPAKDLPAVAEGAVNRNSTPTPTPIPTGERISSEEFVAISKAQSVPALVPVAATVKTRQTPMPTESYASLLSQTASDSSANCAAVPLPQSRSQHLGDRRISEPTLQFPPPLASPDPVKPVQPVAAATAAHPSPRHQLPPLHLMRGDPDPMLLMSPLHPSPSPTLPPGVGRPSLPLLSPLHATPTSISFPRRHSFQSISPSWNLHSPIPTVPTPPPQLVPTSTAIRPHPPPLVSPITAHSPLLTASPAPQTQIEATSATPPFNPTLAPPTSISRSTFEDVQSQRREQTDWLQGKFALEQVKVKEDCDQKDSVSSQMQKPLETEVSHDESGPPSLTKVFSSEPLKEGILEEDSPSPFSSPISREPPLPPLKDQTEVKEEQTSPQTSRKREQLFPPNTQPLFSSPTATEEATKVEEEEQELSDDDVCSEEEEEEEEEEGGEGGVAGIFREEEMELVDVEKQLELSESDETGSESSSDSELPPVVERREEVFPSLTSAAVRTSPVPFPSSAPPPLLSVQSPSFHSSSAPSTPSASPTPSPTHHHLSPTPSSRSIPAASSPQLVPAQVPQTREIKSLSSAPLSFPKQRALPEQKDSQLSLVVTFKKHLIPSLASRSKEKTQATRSKPQPSSLSLLKMPSVSVHKVKRRPVAASSTSAAKSKIEQTSPSLPLVVRFPRNLLQHPFSLRKPAFEEDDDDMIVTQSSAERVAFESSPGLERVIKPKQTYGGGERVKHRQGYGSSAERVKHHFSALSAPEKGVMLSEGSGGQVWKRELDISEMGLLPPPPKRPKEVIKLMVLSILKLLGLLHATCILR